MNSPSFPAQWRCQHQFGAARWGWKWKRQLPRQCRRRWLVGNCLQPGFVEDWSGFKLGGLREYEWGCSLGFVEVEPCKDGDLSGLKQETPGNYYGFHLVRRVKGEANIKHWEIYGGGMVEKSEANDTWPQYALHGRFSTVAFDLIRVTPTLLIVTVVFREEQRIVFGCLYMWLYV